MLPPRAEAFGTDPLSDLGNIHLKSGAAFIYRENNARYIPIKFSVRGRDLGSTVAEAQKRIDRNVNFPEGYHPERSGEFGEYKEAQRRLAYIVPLSLLLVLVLLYSMFNSFRHTVLALAGIPFAVSGGILALHLTGLHFSISAAVGFRSRGSFRFCSASRSQTTSTGRATGHDSSHDPAG